MASPGAGRQGREGRIGGVAEVQRRTDGDRVVLHLTVRGHSVKRHRAVGGAAETGKGGARNSGGRYREGERIESRRQGLTTREQILARVHPVAVPVEVDPGGENTLVARDHIDRRHGAAEQGGGEGDPVFVVGIDFPFGRYPEGTITENRAAEP